MEKSIYSLLCITLLTILSACDRNAGKSATVSIRFPEVVATSSQKLHSQSTSLDTWSAIVPTGFSGANPFNCFGVYVSGPEPDMRQNSCYRSDGTVKKVLGMWKGGVPGGSSVDFEVTPGKDRVVGVFAFNAAPGECKDFTGNNSMNKSALSKPYLLGEVGQLNLEPGKTTEVAVRMTYDSDGWFDDCMGPAFNSDSSPSTGDGSHNPLGNYGTGADGDVVLSAAMSEFSNVNTALGVPMITTSRVMALVPNSSEHVDVTLKYDDVAARFKINDEVVLYVAAASGTVGCGSQVWPGFRTSARVTGYLNGTTMSLQIDDPRFSSLPTAQLQAMAHGVSRDFCRVIASRVPNLNSLTFTGNSHLFYNAISFGDMAEDSLDHSTGFVLIRVKNNLTMTTSGSMDLSGRGFTGGRYSMSRPNGQSSWGADTSATGGMTNGTGGAGYSSGNGPGGGGHGGAGGAGFGGLPGGMGEGDQYGCGPENHDSLMRCLFGKVFMGGGGGAGYDGNGGNGGGAFILTARTLDLGPNHLNIYVNGENAMGGSTMGGAGGAGGSALLNFQNIQATTGSLQVHSNGGYSNSSAAKGGGGAGGRIHLNVVNSCNVSLGGIRLTSYGAPVVKDLAGAAGDDGTTMISGPGAAACSPFIDMNVTPYAAKMDPTYFTAGAPLNIIGKNLSQVATVSIVNSATNVSHPCALTNQNDGVLECDTTGVPVGTNYDVVLTSSSGRKVKVGQTITIN